jgi:hypothetical protein
MFRFIVFLPVFQDMTVEQIDVLGLIISTISDSDNRPRFRSLRSEHSKDHMKKIRDRQ